MPTERVREYMESADIYVFNSDFREGWGAVVNEAMNSACTVLASHAAGSVPFLIENGKNGLIYKCGKISQIEKSLERLIADREYRLSLGKNANQSIRDMWNSDLAVERFFRVYEKISNGEDYKGLFEKGPCSLAKPTKNNWVKR